MLKNNFIEIRNIDLISSLLYWLPILLFIIAKDFHNFFLLKCFSLAQNNPSLFLNTEYLVKHTRTHARTHARTHHIKTIPVEVILKYRHNLASVVIISRTCKIYC